MAGLFFVHVNVFIPRIHALWDVLLCHWMRCYGGIIVPESSGSNSPILPKIHALWDVLLCHWM